MSDSTINRQSVSGMRRLCARNSSPSGICTTLMSGAKRRCSRKPIGSSESTVEYCRVDASCQRVSLGSSRSDLKRQSGCELRNTMPLASTTRTRSSLASQGSSILSRLTLTAATPSIVPSRTIGCEK